MDDLSPVLAVLSAMITPVVLITACATLITSTSNRSARVTDRLHDWFAEFEELAEEESAPGTDRRREMVFEQLDLQTSRARLLQRSLTATYVALGFFVGASVAIGLVGAAWMIGWEWARVALLPIVFSLMGAGCLFFSSYLLITEAQLALRTTDREMDFVWEQGRRYASDELLQRWHKYRRERHRWFGVAGTAGGNIITWLQDRQSAPRRWFGGRQEPPDE
ncbi:MAG: DUF2721 domain-containing protein [Chloroflexi bacterium]|nr:DUF2721 domain-containing protein [Chloroflexota bacterium]